MYLKSKRYPESVSESVTRSPNELFWTAKKTLVNIMRATMIYTGERLPEVEVWLLEVCRQLANSSKASSTSFRHENAFKELLVS